MGWKLEVVVVPLRAMFAGQKGQSNGFISNQRNVPDKIHYKIME